MDVHNGAIWQIRLNNRYVWVSAGLPLGVTTRRRGLLPDHFKGHSCVFSSRCNIYILRLCYDVSVRLSVRLSVTKVHWHIIANLGFKFRSKFIAHCGRGEG